MVDLFGLNFYNSGNYLSLLDNRGRSRGREVGR